MEKIKIEPLWGEWVLIDGKIRGQVIDFGDLGYTIDVNGKWDTYSKYRISKI